MTSFASSDSALDSSAVVVAPGVEGRVSEEPTPHHQTEPTDPGPTASADTVGSATASIPRLSRTMSILALSLGIASFLFAQSVVVPLAAVILGVFGLRDEPAGRSFSIWGIVLACVATFGWVVVVVAGALISLPFLFLATL